jgi:regulator of nucleoside diphosphate kinase
LRKLQIAGPSARAPVGVCLVQAPTQPLKDCTVEITLVERTLTELDHVRLLNLLRRAARGDGSAPPWRDIEDVLDASTLVPSREVAADVVTMQSQVLLQDLQSGQRSTLTLCYPEQADPAVGRVSVLSPVGSALLGLRVGHVARWRNPSGDEKAAEIVAVLFQPESSGDYAM